jgi:hypothetical protein
LAAVGAATGANFETSSGDDIARFQIKRAGG